MPKEISCSFHFCATTVHTTSLKCLHECYIQRGPKQLLTLACYVKKTVM